MKLCYISRNDSLKCRKCTIEEQRDMKNGLMLTPTIHQIFDDGFITFEKKN